MEAPCTPNLWLQDFTFPGKFRKKLQAIEHRQTKQETENVQTSNEHSRATKAQSESIEP